MDKKKTNKTTNPEAEKKTRIKREFVTKEKAIKELWNIVEDYNNKLREVNATHKINALAAIAKLRGWNEAEKSETTIKDMTVTLRF
jgi:uncharacterized protein YnzC (UPF0291/DUF896 family)